jgi:hypothetical protein
LVHALFKEVCLEAPKLFSRFRIDILVISPDIEILKRTMQVTEKFKLSTHRVASLQDYETNFDEIGRPNLILLDVIHCKELSEAQAQIEHLRNFVPKGDVVCIADDSCSGEFLQSLRGLGVFEALLLSQVTTSVRIDFIVLYKFLLGYYPIDLKDLFPGTEINFNAFHFLKLNNKYLPVIFSHFVLSDKKFKKLEGYKNLYIRRDDVEKYQKYIENYYDSFSTGLRRRVKATFLQQVYQYSLFLESLIFQKNEKPGLKPDEIIKGSEALQEKLLGYLMGSDEPMFLYYQNYLENPFLAFDRTPLILGMAALVAHRSSIADPSLILHAGSIGYAGICSMDQLAYLKWHNVDPSQWTEIEREHFSKFVNSSVALGKNKFAEFDEGLSVIISSLFERFDGKGNPGKISGEAIPAETAVLQIVESWLRKASEVEIKNAKDLDDLFRECIKADELSGKLNPEYAQSLLDTNFLTKVKK